MSNRSLKSQVFKNGLDCCIPLFITFLVIVVQFIAEIQASKLLGNSRHMVLCIGNKFIGKGFLLVSDRTSNITELD